MLAAIWANYTPTAFFELEGSEQSVILAAYETHLQIEAVVAEEQARDMRRQAPGKTGRNL